MASLKQLFERRKQRNRRQIRLRAAGKSRLSVYRSNQHIYAQIIDDVRGVTVASASTVEKDSRASLKTGGDLAAASTVGKLIAERAIQAGVKEVVFDRGGYRYHGRIKALADAAREGGLAF